MPKPGNAPLNRCHRVKGPVDLHVSLPASISTAFCGPHQQTYLRPQGSRALHSLLVDARTISFMSKPVGLELGGMLGGERKLWPAGPCDGAAPLYDSTRVSRYGIDLGVAVEIDRVGTGSTDCTDGVEVPRKLGPRDPQRARQCFPHLPCVRACAAWQQYVPFILTGGTTRCKPRTC